ncbi:HAD family hydrolase [Bacillus sp. 31A1R]|uniref:HAD family hydrolase n=1 Tax=Robertmurraya mangrovi TaxID=3098077 RepID=A0ABU5IVQ6_9BACI|nr:HAD family hydrolase [Bacillus sp. 31A1R]MDZ5471231.1 HAD family hydrolase [Bacillus sp. 31A1R]
MVKGVIFDLDGTLLDRESSLYDFLHYQHERLLEELGHIPIENYISRFIDLDGHGYVGKDKVYDQLVNEFCITKITSDHLLADYNEYFRYSCIPFSNLTRMLEGLRKNSIRLGMITNGIGQFQMENIKSLYIQEYFEAILISEWEGVKKPNPEIFHRALEKMNLSVNECVFIGDHPINDIEAAKAIGMKTIWIKNNQWGKAAADETIEDLAEIALILESWRQQKIETATPIR